MDKLLAGIGNIMAKKTEIEKALEAAIESTEGKPQEASSTSEYISKKASSIEPPLQNTHTELNKEPKSLVRSIFDSLSFRTLLVGALILAMLIPLFMVDNIVKERNRYYHSVLDDIAQGWGGMQTIIGPVLVVPYVEHITSVDTVTDNSGLSKTITRDVFNDKTMILLPEDLNIETELLEKHRKRGIYDSLLYTADMNISGHFNLSALPNEGRKYNIRWKKAWLAVGLSDTKAINSTMPLRWEDSSAKFEPGTRLPKLFSQGFHASMKDIKKGGERPAFKIKLSFNGSTGLRFAPLGETTIAKIKSGWPHPSFQGEILPATKTISKKGFEAEWRIPYLARNYPQAWLQGDEKYNLNSVTTGVNLFTSVSLYSKISRAAKYGMLFISLTFITFLIFEITVGKRLHVIQYIVIGVALSLFYLILVSLSEHIKFFMAYIDASVVTVGIISLYTWAAMKSFSRGFIIFLLLSGLYTVLYFILQMEDYALLAGAGVMLFIVIVLMITTRNIKHDA